MKTRNISIFTLRHLKKFNNIRKIRADVFALSQRDVLASLINSRRTEAQIVNEMNKLGLRTATGLHWTAKSMNRVRRRLDYLLRNDPLAKPRHESARYDFNDLETMDWIYEDRLDLLYHSGNDFEEYAAMLYREKREVIHCNSEQPFTLDIDSLDPYYGTQY